MFRLDKLQSKQCGKCNVEIVTDGIDVTAELESKYSTFQPNISVESGKWYFEVHISHDEEIYIGWVDETFVPTLLIYLRLKGIHGFVMERYHYEMERYIIINMESINGMQLIKLDAVLMLMMAQSNIIQAMEIRNLIKGIAFDNIDFKRKKLFPTILMAEGQQIQFVFDKKHFEWRAPDDYEHKEYNESIPFGYNELNFIE